LRPWGRTACWRRRRRFAAIAETQDARTRVNEARADLEAFLELNGPLMRTAPDLYQRGLEERTQALNTAERDLASAQSLSGLPALATDGVLQVRWDALTVEEKRQLLHALMDCIVVRRGRDPIANRVNILWRGQAPNDMPRKGRRTPVVGSRQRNCGCLPRKMSTTARWNSLRASAGTGGVMPSSVAL
jgi:hypothetical protein